MYLCSLSVGLLFCFLINDNMKSSILFHGGTKNLTSPTAKYRMNDVLQ